MNYSRFMPIPSEVVASEELSDKAKIMYGFMSGFFNSNNLFYMSNKEIAKRIGGWSADKISAAIKELQEAGLVYSWIEKNEEGTKRFVTDQVVRIHYKASEGAVRSVGGGAAKSAHGYPDCAAHNIIDNKQENREDNNPLISPKGEVSEPVVSDTDGKKISQNFEELWEVYGRVGSKKKSQQVFERVVRKLKAEEVKTIVDKGKEYAAHLAAAGTFKTTFHKHLTTWLNGECWKDELPALPVAQSHVMRDILAHPLYPKYKDNRMPSQTDEQFLSYLKALSIHGHRP